MPNEQYKLFNCYPVLETQPSANPKEIRSAYKRASLQAHPDTGGSHEAQIKVNLAYEVLSDPVQRQAHDFYWRVDRSAATSGATYNSERSGSATSQDSSTAQPPSGGEALSSLRKKFEREFVAKVESIWSELPARTRAKIDDIQRQINESRKTLLWALGIGSVSGFFVEQAPLLWIPIIWAVATTLTRVGGIEIYGQSVPLFGANRETLAEHAEGLARRQCEDDAKVLNQRRAEFASILELTTRPSSFDDSESYVARRISVALFLMGYMPTYYDGQDRVILFADGDEKLVVRFRHRDGSNANVTYVEKLRALGKGHGAARGILFCSPGLSGNAAAYAESHGIKWYTLESMNDWIGDMSRSDYTGPGGDFMENLLKLTRFLAGIAPRVGRSRHGSRGYRRYR